MIESRDGYKCGNIGSFRVKNHNLRRQAMMADVSLMENTDLMERETETLLAAMQVEKMLMETAENG